MRLRLLPLSLLSLMLAAGVPACSSSSEEAGSSDPSATGDEDDLTSLTARSRKLSFEGYVYVPAGTSDYAIVEKVKDQTQSAFGALREASIGVNDRELGNVDAKTFTREPVKLVDPANPKAPAQDYVRVRYHYEDDAVVPTTAATRSALSLGLLNGYYQSQSQRILKECTDNDAHAKEFESSLWYVFNPSLNSCKVAMTKEQQDIDAARKGLTDGKNQVVAAEVNRLYLPMTAKLAASTTTAGTKYPEYDRLYAGGVKPGRVVVGMVSGLMADWAAGEKHDTIDDDGYPMFLEQLREIFKKHPKLTLAKTDPSVDLTSFTVNGKTYKASSFNDLIKWELDRTGFPAGLSYADQKTLRIAVANKLLKTWLSFEEPLSVQSGKDAARDVTLELNVYFGAETDDAPHRRAIRTSDVFVYNGHSYIGYGPLDPSRYSASDFPSSYQILVINGCVSYNYYEQDYIPLKKGGTQNLDLITNGLESWVNGSGPAMGRLVATLLDGKQESYANILKSAQFDYNAYQWGNDALRVVDGEVDNKYSPSKSPLKITIK